MSKPSCLTTISRSFALFLVLLFLFGCAAPRTMRPASPTSAVEAEAFKQRCLMIQEDLAFRERLLNVSFRVSDAAKQMTMKREYSCGFLVLKGSHFAKENQAPAAEVLRLGTGARVAAGSVVYTDVPAHSTAHGNPARVAKLP